MAGKYKETGQYAYEAYGNTVKWRNYRGDPMPRWENLPPGIQEAWRQAAHAAIRYGWQGKDAPQVPGSWQHIEVPGSSGRVPAEEETRTSHRASDE